MTYHLFFKEMKAFCFVLLCLFPKDEQRVNGNREESLKHLAFTIFKVIFGKQAYFGVALY